ncbi:MAG: sigma 54-interacting transcriptional regulator [Desulfomonilaceae bacterium]
METLRVLIVEDNFVDALCIKEALEATNSTSFAVSHVENLAEAKERLEKEAFNVMVLDLGLPDSQGIETFLQMKDAAPSVPIVLMSGLDDETLAVEAVRGGAQDYLLKDKWDVEVLKRSINYAIERHRLLWERRQSEDALRLSERRFKTIFERAEACICLKDQSLRFVDVNPAFETLAGLPASEIIGTRHEDVFGNDAAEFVRDADLRVLKGETIEDEHSKTLRGVRRTFLATRVPLRDVSDEVVGILTLLHDVTDRKSAEVAPALAEEYPSKAMRSTLNQVRIAAKSNSTILLTGESGSGKEYLAQYIHNYSDRAGGPFFTLNCAAIAEQLAESELFGHEKGSFTGAVARKRGVLELAEGGTLLLNEIGELPLPLQAKLLTFLDSKKFPRVGGEKEISVNARLIAATNRDLKKEVEAGRFRQDLFYRINVMSISVPPLRERLEDIPILVKEILAKLREELQIHEMPVVDREVISTLKRYDWPGNVRELRNVLERSLILSRGKHLGLEALRIRGGKDRQSLEGDETFSVSFPNHRSLNEITKDVKRFLIDGALRKSEGSRQGAARLLGISRYSLKHYMKSLGYSEEG